MKSVYWGAALLLVLVLLFSSFFLLLRSPDFYQWLMRKNQVYQQVDLPEAMIDQAAVTISDYITGQRPQLLIEHQGESLLKAQEIFHMHEVRAIFSKMRTGLIFIGLVLAGLVALTWKTCHEILIKQFWLMLGLFGLLGLGAVFFERAFLLMHQLLFNNPFWAFGPEHYLIRLLPEGFFLGFLLATAALALVISTAGFIMGRYQRGTRA